MVQKLYTEMGQFSGAIGHWVPVRIADFLQHDGNLGWSSPFMYSQGV